MRERFIFRPRAYRAVAVASGALVLAWEGLGRALEIRPDLLPTPSRIVLEIGRGWSMLLEHASITAWEVICGLLLSGLIAIPVSLGLEAFPATERWSKNILRASYAAPLVSAGPLLVVWFGFGRLSKIMLASLLAFFPLVASVLRGLSSPSLESFDLMRMMGAGRIQCLLKLQLPASLPYLFRGLKVAVLFAVAGALVAEFVAAETGLGHLLLSAQSRFNIPLLFAALLWTLLIPALLCALLSLLERLVVPWRPPQTTGFLGSMTTATAPRSASTIKIEKPSA